MNEELLMNNEITNETFESKNQIKINKMDFSEENGIICLGL
jgi:hypothetical protein